MLGNSRFTQFLKRSRLVDSRSCFGSRPSHTFVSSGRSDLFSLSNSLTSLNVQNLPPHECSSCLYLFIGCCQLPVCHDVRQRMRTDIIVQPFQGANPCGNRQKNRHASHLLPPNHIQLTSSVRVSPAFRLSLSARSTKPSP